MVVDFLKSRILKAVRLVKVMSILLGKTFSSCNICVFKIFLGYLFIRLCHPSMVWVLHFSLFSLEKLRNYRTFRNDEVLLDMLVVL